MTRAAQIEELAKLRAQGLSNGEIAARMGTTLSHVKYLLLVSDIPQRNFGGWLTGERWTPNRLETLDSLLQQHTFSQAAQIMGKTKNALAGAAWRHLGGKTDPPASKPVLQFPPRGTCLWIDGDVLAHTAAFTCQGRVAVGEAYCPTHRRRVYQQPIPPA